MAESQRYNAGSRQRYRCSYRTAILQTTAFSTDLWNVLFAVDEETGLTGAFALKEGFMNGDILLNLDSEDEGELFIGCAGGIDSVAEFTYKEVDVLPDTSAARCK